MDIKKYCHQAVTKAIKEGRLIPDEFCSECGLGGFVGCLVAHHDEYSIEKALDVRWMHWSCHAYLHKSKFKAKIVSGPKKLSKYYLQINGNKIKSEREKMGLSISELARKLNVPRQSVYEWEKGNLQRISTINQVADFFNIEFLQLFDGRE